MIIEALVGLFIITSLVYFIFVRLAERQGFEPWIRS